ncbi:hypothetical protein [Sphingomonas crocodyli]|uniref:Uncharacterized protein n=1 Tax=Sphingomonas crocodyli TaxID=1979270 RepID=A0A437M7F0_9SPHN|nr:hypothetical protein [Sphingomonas crocodyli]RVT93424.1 hypothetical protein EOD43_05985 [Sphingomonas crocodyli]
MRSRKTPPVPVPDGSKFCFKCKLVLPLALFAKDAKQYDGKKHDCRRCDSAAAYQRQLRKRAGPSPDALMAEPLIPVDYDRIDRARRNMRLASGTHA